MNSDLVIFFCVPDVLVKEMDLHFKLQCYIYIKYFQAKFKRKCICDETIQN